MKRKLFFFIEKLQISKNERIAVSILSVMVLITGTVTLVWEPGPAYSEYEYERLERIFEEKSRQIKQENDLILTRYEPLEQGAANMEQVEPDESQWAASDTVQPPAGQTGSISEKGLININSATREELLALPGIGPAYSKRIVEWRNEHGRFTSVNQLLEIKGIGEKRLANIKPLITLRQSE